MKRLIHFSRKKRQFNFQKKLKRKYILALLAIFGTHQLSAQINFAPAVDDPYGIFHHFETYNPDLQTQEQQYYTEFIDIDDDGDLDLLFFENKKEYINPDHSSVYGYFFQENTIDVNGLFGDTSIVDFQYNGYTEFIPWAKLRYLDFDEDGDLDLYGIMSYDYGHSDGIYFKSYQNNSDQLGVFNFSYYESDFSERLCSNRYDYSCYQYFEVGDLDNDSDDDLLIYSQTNYGEEIEDASFQFYKNNGEVELSPFDAAIENPFNLDDIVSHLLGDSSNIIIDISIQDLNNDETSELITYYLDNVNARFVLECFFLDETTKTFDSQNSQILVENDSLNVSENYFYFLASGFKFVDLDKDGDLDMYNTFAYQGEDYYDFTQKLKYFENRTIVTSVENQQFQEITISPNPMNHQSIIKFENKQHQKAIIKVFDAIGRIVQEYSTNENQVTIERKQLVAGMYTIEVKVMDEFFNGKLVVE